MPSAIIRNSGMITAIKIPAAGRRNAFCKKIYDNMVGQPRAEKQIAAGKNCHFTAKKP